MKEAQGPVKVEKEEETVLHSSLEMEQEVHATNTSMQPPILLLPRDTHRSDLRDELHSQEAEKHGKQ